ncbi:MAG: hypothetical protein IT458_06450 [Planctomycetes bacterium]|nr:hypothetical protein [Planctomycetota bacterium]
MSTIAMSTRALVFVLPLLLAPLCAQNFVRVRDNVLERRGPAGPGQSAPDSVAPPHCGTRIAAYDGEPILNGGGATLITNAFMNPACMNRTGTIAFYAGATGARNQGIFVADGTGVRAIVMGCGQGGGSGQHGTCGDPSPVGGTFAGFFSSTVFAPPINEDGDVLFLADIKNGTTTRGLFLYLAGSQTIVKVAGVGDPSPLGGVFTALGPGSLDRDRQVLFLARSTGSNQYLADIFRWKSGTVSRFCVAGDPAPGGATVGMLGTESFGFVDGTTVFAGPLPSINDCGQVAYRIITTGGPVGVGIAVRSNGTDAWYLTDTMSTPVGGTYFDFQGPILNGGGQIAVFAEFMQGGNPSGGWFVGRPGSWRAALCFNDPVDGGLCIVLGFSRPPMTPLSDNGDLVVWCDLDPNQTKGRILLSAADGSRTVLARQGGPTGTGADYGVIDGWPSMDSSGRVSISTGATGGTWNSAHLTPVLCGPGVSSNPCRSPGDTLQIDDYGPGGASFVLFFSTAMQNQPLPPFGTLLIGPTPILALTGVVPYPGFSGPHAQLLPIPNNPALRGLSLHFQSLALIPSDYQLTNRATSLLR